MAERHAILPGNPGEIRESCAHLVNQLWGLSQKLIYLSEGHRRSCDYTSIIQKALLDASRDYYVNIPFPFIIHMVEQREKTGLKW